LTERKMWGVEKSGKGKRNESRNGQGEEEETRGNIVAFTMHGGNAFLLRQRKLQQGPRDTSST